MHRREIPPLRGAARSQERTRKKKPRRFGRNDRFYLRVVLTVLIACMASDSRFLTRLEKAAGSE